MANYKLYKYIISFIILCACFDTVFTGTMEYRNKELMDAEYKYRVGLALKQDSHGSLSTWLKLNQTFENTSTKEDASVDILVYHSSYSYLVGIKFEEMPTMCCTSKLVDQKICPANLVGHAIVAPLNGTDKVLQYKIDIPAGELAHFESKFEPAESGIIYIHYIRCEPITSEILLAGTIQFQNPFGQLSADLWSLLPFFGIAAIFYAALLLYWIAISCYHRSRLLMLQHCIGVVTLLGFIECTTWYFDFLTYNSNGHFSWGAIVTGIASSTLKRTVSRLLVLVVSMGYGVVKYNLGGTRNKVLFLGLLYFIASGLQQLLEVSLREGESNEFVIFCSTVVIFPVALLDTVFYWWIFLSLMKTIQQLYIRQASVKLQLYKRFFVVLVIAGILTAIAVAIQLFIELLSERDAHWQTMWQFKAYWHMLYFFILISIAFLWRPTTNNTRYAYTESEDAEIMLEVITKDNSKSKNLDDDNNNRNNNNNDDISSIGNDLELPLPSFTIDEDEDFLDEAAKLN